MRSFVSRILPAAALLTLGLAASSAQAQTFTLTPFTGDAASVNLVVSQLTASSVRFDASVNTSVSLGDLRGIFFNVANESLISGLTITGADVTSVQKSANGVDNLGGGVNTNPEGPFDIGVEIGTSGIGKDDIRSTSFVVSSTVPLSASQFTTATDAGTLKLIVAARVTSVGTGSNRNGSSKLGAVSANPIPEPATVAFFAVSGALGLIARRRKSR